MGISKIFKEELYILDLVHDEMYNDYFLKYLISLMLIKKQNCSILYIEQELCNIFGENSIILKELIKFLDVNFVEIDYENGIFEIKEEDKIVLESVEKFKNILILLDTYTSDELCNIISSLMMKDWECDFPPSLPYILSLMKDCIKISLMDNDCEEYDYDDIKLNNVAANICLAKYHDFLHTYDKKVNELENILENIDDS